VHCAVVLPKLVSETSHSLCHLANTQATVLAVLTAVAVLAEETGRVRRAFKLVNNAPGALHQART